MLNILRKENGSKLDNSESSFKIAYNSVERILILSIDRLFIVVLVVVKLSKTVMDT